MGSLDGVEIEFCHLYSLHLIRIRPRPLLTKNIKNRHNLSNVSSTMRVSVRSFFPSSLHRRRERDGKKKWSIILGKEQKLTLAQWAVSVRMPAKKSHNIISFLKKSAGQIERESWWNYMRIRNHTYVQHLLSTKPSHGTDSFNPPKKQNVLSGNWEVEMRDDDKLFSLKNDCFWHMKTMNTKRELWKVWNSRDV